MSIADLNCAEIEVLSPAMTCMVCERQIENIGGRRLVAQRSRGTNVFDHAMSEGFENFHSCTRLFDQSELYLVIWGEGRFVSSEVVTRVKAAYRVGLRPWFCQVCGSRLCSACGERMFCIASAWLC